MVKQISLDAWQIQYLTGLLRKGSEIVDKTNTPTVLYRHTIEENENAYEEIVCTLSSNYVIEQLVTSGGPVVPNFNQQFVFTIEDYPGRLMKKSKELFFFQLLKDN